MEEFQNIFGSDLKAVTGDTKQIEEVLRRVDSLRLPIEGIGFNPFDFYKISSWKIIMQDFSTSVQVSLCQLNCLKFEFWTNIISSDRATSCGGVVGTVASLQEGLGFHFLLVTFACAVCVLSHCLCLYLCNYSAYSPNQV